MNLTYIDWLIMVLYFVFVLGIGFALKRFIKTSKDYLQAGRSLPAWICGLAFISANLGAQEVIGMGASGAKYGIVTSQFYWIGAIPAMIFVGVFMMPFYYGSKARSVPEFLRLRFDEKTRAWNACTFAFMTVLSSGISMYAMARLIQTLHVFDKPLHALGLPLDYSFHIAIVLSAIIVLCYIFLGGLTSAIYNEVLQFFLIVAGFLPLVWVGLKNVGGWHGLKAALPAAYMHSWRGLGSAQTNPLGVDWFGLVAGLGFVLSFGYWCTDFLVIQTAMAANSEESARRVPLIAAVPKMFFPFLVILPGLIAIGTPAVMRHAAAVATPVGMSASASAQAGAVAEGKGLIPAKVDPVTGKVMLDTQGHPVLDYDLAIPNMLLYYFPTGILGLGLTALLASFMSGMAGNVTAFNTVWTFDLYQSYIHKGASDAHYLKVGRWTTVVGILISMGCAYLVMGFNNIMDTLQLVFSIVNAPLFATFLLGMFWKRSTGHAAFTGLAGGTLAAVLHHGLTIPAATLPGIHGGWLHVVHVYPSEMALDFWQAIFAFSINFTLTVIISLMTKPRPESELVGLVYSLTPKPVEHHMAWYAKPSNIAIGLLVLLVGLNFVFR
ncbi:MAG: sodium:solute symporter family protein [Acidobacteriaceae bacterium]